jgi:hypothetical protein
MPFLNLRHCYNANHLQPTTLAGMHAFPLKTERQVTPATTPFTIIFHDR